MDDNAEKSLQQSVNRALGEHLRWLLGHMHPYFAITMQDEPGAVCTLALRLQGLANEIASSLVYRGDREAEFMEMLKGHPVRLFAGDQEPPHRSAREPIASAV